MATMLRYRSSNGCKRKQANLPPAQVYTSVKTIKITGVEVNVENPHSDETNLRCRDASTVITRRGRSIVLRINFSIQLTIAYTITTTFIPVYGPKERSSTFRGTGNGNGQSKLFLSIEIPSNFPIGHYDLYVTISLRGHPEVLMYTLHSALVILFNSSHPEDDVYIDSEDKNYVLKNVGVIWRGTDSQPLPISWEYGQYQLLCLDVALSLLKNLSANKRRSAVYVAQAILSHISPSDGNGILSIPSNGRYMGGVYPSKWSSSVPIIQRYYHTKRPVKFGQYWTGTALAITLLRSLGIPCRPVTIYNAAMAVEKLGKVSCYFSPEGNLVEGIKNDSIWAYHVMVECWMKRNDLPVGYDGWQVMDFITNGPHHFVGPTPVSALCETQNISPGGDASYFKSLINSEIKYFRVNHSYATMTNQVYSLAQVQKHETGTKIVTCSSKSDKWIDVSNYCNHLPTNAVPTSESPYPYPAPSCDCSVELICSHVTLGKDFDITITLHNNGPMVRNIDGRILGASLEYTGKNSKNFIAMKFEGAISPEQTATVILPIKGRQYIHHLKDQNMLHFFIVAKTRETNQLFFIHKYHQFDPLSVQIKAPSSVAVGENELYAHKEIAYRQLLLPGKKAFVTINVTATIGGSFTMLASMHCHQLTDIRGQKQIQITKN